MRIAVEDKEGRVLGGVGPAEARILQKVGLAEALKDPFRLRLAQGLRRIPTVQEINQMATAPRGYGRALDPARARNDISMFVAMAKEQGVDSPEVWIVNKTADKISMEIDIAGSDDPIHLRALPVSPHPYNLTSEIELESLVKSRNFKTMLRQVFRDRMNPAHPLTGKPVVELWTSEEAEAHYSRFAQRTGRHWQEVAAEEQEKRQRQGLIQDSHYNELAGFAAPRTAVELAGHDLARRGITKGFAGLTAALTPEQAQALMSEERALHERLAIQGQPNSGQLYVADHVAPRVMQLCHESSAAIEQGARLPAAEFIAELSSLEHTLSESDLDYIQAHGTYGQVKQWAARLRAEKFPEEGLVTDEPAPFGGVSMQMASDAPTSTAAALAGAQFEGPTGFANGPSLFRTNAESLPGSAVPGMVIKP